MKLKLRYLSLQLVFHDLVNLSSTKEGNNDYPCFHFYFILGF